MPLYEYECSACGHHFEVIRKFSDPPEEKCPKCGGLVHKLQSAPAFQFKGTGWYVTDYAKNSQPDSRDGKPEGKADAGGKKDATTETSGKTESATSGSSSSPASSSTPAASGTAASKSGD